MDLSPSGTGARVRTHRIFVLHLTSGETVLTGDEAYHLERVLRVVPGTPIRAFDGRGSEAPGEVTEVEPMRVTLSLGEPRPSEREPPVHITLATALLKGDKLASVVRMATELGASRFAPFVSRRCDVKTLSGNKLERLRRVAKEAAKQSGRSLVPTVEEPRVLENLSPETFGLLAHPSAVRTLQEVLHDRPLESLSSLTLVTGPEGGLTDEEVERLQNEGFSSVRLGTRILRAETAPVALLAALLLPEAL